MIMNEIINMIMKILESMFIKNTPPVANTNPNIDTDIPIDDPMDDDISKDPIYDPTIDKNNIPSQK